MTATVYYRGCTKHVNPNPKKIKPSTACPVCDQDATQATAKIAGRMSRILGNKRKALKRGKK